MKTTTDIINAVQHQINGTKFNPTTITMRYEDYLKFGEVDEKHFNVVLDGEVVIITRKNP